MLSEEYVSEEINQKKYKATLGWFLIGVLSIYFIMLRGQGDNITWSIGNVLQYAQSVGLIGVAMSFFMALLIPAPIALLALFFKSCRNMKFVFKVYRVFFMALLAFVLFGLFSLTQRNLITTSVKSEPTHPIEPIYTATSPAQITVKPALIAPAAEGSKFSNGDLMNYAIGCATLTRRIDGDDLASAIMGKSIYKMSQLAITQEAGEKLIENAISTTLKIIENNKNDSNYLIELRNELCNDAEILIPNIMG